MSDSSSTSIASCADLVRTRDWSRTRLGPYEQWPERLKGYVAMVLEMPTPAIIFWGPDQVQLYNDGYSVIMGPRHPMYYGASYRECWPDTYPVIYPMMQRVLRGEVIEVKNALFTVTRYGFTEEAYFTFTFSPLRDDTGAIAGILQPVVEVTQEVIGARRVETLRSVPPAAAGENAAGAVMLALSANPKDVPFALYYGRGEGDELALGTCCGIDDALTAKLDDVPQIVRDVLASGTATVVDTAQVLAGTEHTGTWGDPTREAFVVPVRRSISESARGVAVLGISPRVRFDNGYQGFFESVARELAAHLDAQRATRAERELLHAAEAAQVETDAQRRRLYSIFENAPVAITILAGPKFVVEMANPLLCQLWGRSREDVLDKELFVALPEVKGQGLEQLLDGVRTTGNAYVGNELRVKVRRRADADPQDVYFNFVYEPMKDPDGQVSAIIVVATDVTVHVLARQAAEALAAELEAARREAEIARDVAQQASRSKDEFLAMLGHELRNPLAPIFTALELMRLRDADGVNTRERDVIERQARHLRVLVEDLLDISRITSGKVELKRGTVDLGPIINKAIETASPLFETRRHELQIDVDPGLVVDADPARLTQVFANLLTNAAKYTDAGGSVSVQARRDGGGIRVAVSDTGRGMSRDMLARVFDLFVQEQQNLDRSMGGLGIGLAIVKNLVAMHGGSVEAHSPGAGKGSTFVVRLPAVTRDTWSDVAQRKSPTPVPAAPARARILVVDDNEDAAMLLGEVLGALGYVCTIATDGPQALELAKHKTFDLVLLDIGLPAMDGYEVARHLRELPGGRAFKLIALTGYGAYNDKQRSYEAGFDHHLVKPVDLSALTSVLEPSVVS